MATMDISPKSLEGIASLCHDSVLNKVRAGVSYGAKAHIYKQSSIGKLKLSIPQCLLLSLINSLVAEDQMSCCMLADISHQVLEFCSDHLRAWLVEDFVFPRQEIEKAIALLSKLLTSEILKLPSHVTQIFCSLANNYGIQCTQLTSPQMEECGNLAIQRDNVVNVKDSGDLTALIKKARNRNSTTNSMNSSNDPAAEAPSTPSLEIKCSMIVSPMDEAVKNDSVTSIKALLAAGAKIDKRFFGGDTYLHIAAGESLNKALELLLEEGINKDEKNYHGETPLVRAVRKGNIEGMEILLKKGANTAILPPPFWPFSKESLEELIIKTQNVDMFKVFVREKTEHNRLKISSTLFHSVASSGNAEMLKVMRDQKQQARIKNLNGLSPLHVTSDPSIVRILVEMGVDINERTRKNETALHLASAKGPLELVRALVEQGADVDAQDAGGTTAIMIALINNNDSIATFLLHNGARPNDQDKEGKAPLHYAAKEGYLALASTLLDAGAEIDLVDNERKSPAFRAAEKNKLTVLSLLCERDVDLTLIDSSGKGILQCATCSGCAEAVALLLELGPPVDDVDCNNLTSLHYAAKEGHISVMSVLLDYGADLECQRDEDGYTPLMYASSAGRLDVVKLLIARGAWVNNKNHNKQTAMYLAIEHRYTDIVDYLRTQGGTVSPFIEH